MDRWRRISIIIVLFVAAVLAGLVVLSRVESPQSPSVGTVGEQPVGASGNVGRSMLSHGGPPDRTESPRGRTLPEGESTKGTDGAVGDRVHPSPVAPSRKTGGQSP